MGRISNEAEDGSGKSYYLESIDRFLFCLQNCDNPRDQMIISSNLGILKSFVGDNISAITWHDKVMNYNVAERSEIMGMLHSAMGFTWLKTENYRKALSAYLEAVKKHPSSWIINFQLFRCANRLDKLKELSEMYHSIESQNENCPIVCFFNLRTLEKIPRTPTVNELKLQTRIDLRIERIRLMLEDRQQPEDYSIRHLRKVFQEYDRSEASASVCL